MKQQLYYWWQHGEVIHKYLNPIMDLKPPTAIDLNGNFLNEWTRFKQKCKKLNHFATFACKAQNLNNIEPNDVGDSIASQDLNIETIVFNNVDSTDSWHQSIIVNGVSISFKLDTGADVNVIPYKLYQQLAPDTLT